MGVPAVQFTLDTMVQRMTGAGVLIMVDTEGEEGPTPAPIMLIFFFILDILCFCVISCIYCLLIFPPFAEQPVTYSKVKDVKGSHGRW